MRSALALKGLPYGHVAVQIARGEHKKPLYVDLSADTLVPLLALNRHQLSQSMAGPPRTPAVFDECMRQPAVQAVRPSARQELEA